MAPRMAASVLSSPVVLVFLLVFPVFCFANTISFTRDELLNLRQYTPQNLLPDFNYSDVLLKVVVGGAAALIKRFRTRRRGKRAGALVELRQRRFRMALPSIHLANLRSLPNKTDELLLLSRLNKDFSHSAALCFTETWLNDAIPDGALHLPGYQLFRADRDAESTGKSRGGGTCFYINERWCTDLTVLKKMCCPDLDALFIDCKPFYSPREFCSFILISVYIPPQANVSLALQKLADQIADMEQKHPDSVLIILGDFNKANLSRELPKYSQHVTCPTRDSNILDHCYTTIRNAYHSVPRAALGLSDHCLVHLIPSYRQKLKSAIPVVKTVKRWTNETERVLQACFELTDWSVFEAAAYISFCEDMCIPTRTYLTYNNDNPWFTAKLRQLRQAKEDAYRYGDKVLYKQAKYTLEKEIKVAKRNYSEKLRNKFYFSDFSSVWKGLKVITNYKTPSPSTVENQQLADDLNEFYCRSVKTRCARSSERTKEERHQAQTIFNRSLELCEVDDAVNMGLHFILQHLDKSGTYWITSFLTDRQQLVKLGKFSSCTRTISTGAPQGCVLSPLLFSLYTNDCTSKDPSVKLLKFADDTTVIGLIQDGDESAYRQEVKELTVWCSHNNLEHNTLKTIEMTVDFRKNPPALPPLTIRVGYRNPVPIRHRYT
ncbi:hypothetical protein M9458_057240 [Cirrhinus mrigala]|uniref:Reverse transcriptase domain-containing protein n=1 Tax=Cirrhinus mrigala TaxID=683832 RepID=A0ABD0MBG8_CIRMR